MDTLCVQTVCRTFVFRETGRRQWEWPMKNRAEEASYYFAEPVRRAFEALRQPMAVCQALDEKTRALLVSDSLVRLVGMTQFLSGGHVSQRRWIRHRLPQRASERAARTTSAGLMRILSGRNLQRATSSIASRGRERSTGLRSATCRLCALKMAGSATWRRLPTGRTRSMDSSPRTSSSPPSRRRIGSVNSTSTC